MLVYKIASYTEFKEPKKHFKGVVIKNSINLWRIAHRSYKIIHFQHKLLLSHQKIQHAV